MTGAQSAGDRVQSAAAGGRWAAVLGWAAVAAVDRVAAVAVVVSAAAAAGTAVVAGVAPRQRDMSTLRISILKTQSDNIHCPLFQPFERLQAYSKLSVHLCRSFLQTRFHIAVFFRIPW